MIIKIKLSVRKGGVPYKKRGKFMNCDIEAETQTIVCKFGGTSMADEASVEKVAAYKPRKRPKIYSCFPRPARQGNIGR